MVLVDLGERKLDIIQSAEMVQHLGDHQAAVVRRHWPNGAKY